MEKCSSLRFNKITTVLQSMLYRTMDKMRGKIANAAVVGKFSQSKELHFSS